LGIDFSIFLNFPPALALFLLVNWIGKHSESFGYRSVTLFEDVEEPVAFNFLIRVIPPSIIIVALSALFIHLKIEQYRFGIYWISIFYYAIRASYNLIFDLWRLINWGRFFVESSLGISMSIYVYKYMVIPKLSLLPDLQTAGNEIWFAIAIFIYAVANNVRLENVSRIRRKNGYIKTKYKSISDAYGGHIKKEVTNRNLQLTIYAIILYEDYCRPRFVRFAERLIFWKDAKTTGIMQVNNKNNLSDFESVKRGVAKILNSWNSLERQSESRRIRQVIAEFNRDDDYVSRVYDIMKLISKRADRSFELDFEGINDSEFWGYTASKRVTSKNIQIRRLSVRSSKK
jgi:hypothetical protein